MIPNVVTEKGRQDCILAALLDYGFSAELPGFILNTSPAAISAALRIKENLSLEWSEFEKGYHFCVHLSTDQRILLSERISFYDYIYVTPIRCDGFTVVDCLSLVPIEIRVEPQWDK